MQEAIAEALIEAQPLHLKTVTVNPNDLDNAKHLCALRRYIASAHGYESKPGKERPGALQQKTHFLGALGELKANADPSMRPIIRGRAPLLDSDPSRYATDDAELYTGDAINTLRIDIKTTDRPTFAVNKQEAEADEHDGVAAYLVLRCNQSLDDASSTTGEWWLIPLDYFKKTRKHHSKPDARGKASEFYTCRLPEI